MMSEIEPEVLEKASLAKDPTEIILMGLVFWQQEMIGELMGKLKFV